MKNSKTLKNVIDVLTAFIYFCGITTVLALLVHLLSRMGLFKDLIQTGRLSFDVNGIQLFPKTPQPLWQLLFPLVSSAIYIYLLLTIRSFLQNLYQEKIFSHSNIDLCNRAWKILLVLSFLSGSMIIVNLDVMLAKRKMKSNELADKIGITTANLSILKTGKAKAIRFTTLEAICKELDCQPGEILEYRPDE